MRGLNDDLSKVGFPMFSEHTEAADARALRVQMSWSPPDQRNERLRIKPMPSGYEKSPDYGGTRPPDYPYLAFVAVCIAAYCVVVWLLREYLLGRL